MEYSGFGLAFLFACLAFVAITAVIKARLQRDEAITSAREALELNDRILKINFELMEVCTGWKNLAEDWKHLCYEASGTAPAK